MHLLVFQHCQAETPAAFANHAASAGDRIEVVRLFANESIPNLNSYDALIVMGGPMDIWDTQQHPWLAIEKLNIKTWLDSGKPYLGICLGHQLLVEAAGGVCQKMQTPEISISDVTLTINANDDALCRGLSNSFPAMHWHGVEAVSLPKDSQLLGSSDNCKTQILRVGETAWGLQFHPELVQGTLSQWMTDKSNLDAASAWLGSEKAAWDFVENAELEANGFIDRSAKIYQNFRSLV